MRQKTQKDLRVFPTVACAFVRQLPRLGEEKLTQIPAVVNYPGRIEVVASEASEGGHPVEGGGERLDDGVWGDDTRPEQKLAFVALEPWARC